MKRVLPAVIAGFIIFYSSGARAASYDPAYESATPPRRVSWCDGRPGDSRSYCWRNCTSYVAFKLAAAGVLPSDYMYLGHAKDWAINARRKGITTGSEPMSGAVAYWKSGGKGFGHVAWVDLVNADGTVRISSYNGFTESFFVQEHVVPEGYIYFSNVKNMQITIKGDRLNPGQSLRPTEYLRSANGRYVLRFRADGNLMLSSPSGKTIWRNYLANGSDELVMQLDGNLVLYDRVRPRWHTWTWTRGRSFAVIQNDGNFVVYTSSGQPTWHTGTNGQL